MRSENDNFNLSKKLEHFSDLCYQAELMLIDINEKATSLQRENFRSMVGVHLLALMLNTAHSIHTLLKNDSIYASAILVRSMYEQWVNLRYIYLSPHYENLVRYLYSGDHAFIKNANDAARAFKAHNPYGHLDDFIEDAEESIAYRVSSSKGLLKYGHPLKQMPPFADRVNMIVEKDDDIETMFWYHYDYSTYSNNVHASKDKIIEMTYAETYNDWFQAKSYGGSQDALRIINTAGDIVSKSFLFFSRRKGGLSSHKFHKMRKAALFNTNIYEYQQTLVKNK